MPSILYFGRGGKDWTKDYPIDPRAPVVFYMLPPIRYPDGNLQILPMLNPILLLRKDYTFPTFPLKKNFNFIFYVVSIQARIQEFFSRGRSDSVEKKIHLRPFSLSQLLMQYTKKIRLPKFSNVKILIRKGLGGGGGVNC
jgi:hypothetical protein